MGIAKRRATRVRIFNGTVAVEARLRAHLTRQLDFALSGFGDRVERILVRLSRGEPVRESPERCEIEVVMRPRRLSVVETGGDLFTAVENASHRIKRSVTRALEREQAWSEVPPALRVSSPAAKAARKAHGRELPRGRRGG
jgi:ribosome-associated translation inhibitor RaiA